MRIEEMKGIDLGNFSSINAEEESSYLSNKYNFVPTTQIVEDIGKEGWLPVKAQEVNARAVRSVGFQKHLIRFRNPEFKQIKSSKDLLYPEIVLMNSHDGTASFRMMAGLFRLICVNGLIVSDSTICTFVIKHIGYTKERVSEAIEEIISVVPKITNRVNEFQKIILPLKARKVYAHKALKIKYGEELIQGKMNVDALLQPWRKEDESPNLWSTYNVVQEKFLNILMKCIMAMTYNRNL